jgi:hypothetical protein
VKTADIVASNQIEPDDDLNSLRLQLHDAMGTGSHADQEAVLKTTHTDFLPARGLGEIEAAQRLQHP